MAVADFGKREESDFSEIGIADFLMVIRELGSETTPSPSASALFHMNCNFNLNILLRQAEEWLEVIYSK